MKDRLSFIHKLCLPSIFDLIVITGFMAIILASPVIKSFDIFWHLRTGELLLNGVFPIQDIYSYTAHGKPWLLHEWGTELIFAFVYGKAGVPGLIVLKSFIIAFTYGVAFNLMLRKNINIFVAFVFFLITIPGTAGSWTVRPHIFTYLFIVLLFRIYFEFRHNKNHAGLKFLPILFLFWINLHGGFVIGFIFIGACLVADIIEIYFNPEIQQTFSYSDCKKLLIYSIISFAACFINPNTYKGVLYPLLYISDQIPSELIQEWAPTSIKNSLAFVPIVFLLIIGFAFKKKKLNLYEIALVSVFTFFAFTAHRHVSLFTLILVPILAPFWQEIIIIVFKRIVDQANGWFHTCLIKVDAYFTNRSEWFLRVEKQLNYHVLLIVGIILFSIICIYSGEKLGIGIHKERYPDKIVNFIEQNNIQGNIFNQYSWGGYLIWRLLDRKVFIDGRMDVYKKEITQLYQTLINMEDGWEKIIDDYSIRHLVLKKDEILSRFIVKLNPEWLLIMETDNAYLISKRN